MKSIRLVAMNCLHAILFLPQYLLHALSWLFMCLHVHLRMLFVIVPADVPYVPSYCNQPQNLAERTGPFNLQNKFRLTYLQNLIIALMRSFIMLYPLQWYARV